MLFLCTENTPENNAFARESEEYDIMCLRVGKAQDTVKRAVIAVRRNEMDLNRMGEILDDLAEEIPEEFYRDLSAGIVLTPEIKKSPYGDDMTIMGEYVRSNLGRGIKIYGGSINSVYGWMSEEQMTEQLREVLRHEFTHHIESLAGERGLEIKDEEQIREYLERKSKRMKR